MEQAKTSSNLFDYDKKSIPIIAIETNNIDILKEAIENGGSNVNESYDDHKVTLLTLASRHGYNEIVVYLLDNGASIDMFDPNNLTALHRACISGRCITVDILLKKGANINLRNKQGNSALLMACANHQFDVVKILLSHGADVNLRDLNNCTPLLIAAVANNYGIVKLLLQNNAVINNEDEAVNPIPIIAENSKTKGSIFILNLLRKHELTHGLLNFNKTNDLTKASDDTVDESKQ